MQLHTMKNNPGARKAKTRVGRGPGSGLGKTAGRGHKGQYARSGHKHKAGFEGGQMRLVRRLPKRRVPGNPLKRHYAAVNVGSLDQFAAGTEVTVAVLRQSGLVKGVWDGVRVLGSGELSKKLTVKVHGFSASARSKIEAAGGACEVVS